MTFSELQLIEPLLRAVRDAGYTTPTPIQAQAIPHVLAGRDLLGCAQTGTGKTAAFALPILQHLTETPAPSGRGVIRALVLSPTRELAAQIGDSFAAYGRYLKTRHQVIYGGVGQNPQVQGLQRRPEVVVATPGRLLDLMGQGFIRLASVEIFVLDEADRMLDMGFFPDVKRVIAALPAQRQNLMFSATMPAPIQDLASNILREPAFVEVTPRATTVEKIAQSLYYVNKRDKRALLVHLLEDKALKRVLVFTRTKHGANKLTEQLAEAGIRADAIHGNKSQSARERALSDFKTGRIRALVATDIAARGIDVDDVTHVINYDLPVEPESYVHRIGRTARAGADGSAYSFCDAEERGFLRDIERLIRITVPVVADHPYMAAYVAPISDSPRKGQNNRGGRPSFNGGARESSSFRSSDRPQARRPEGERSATSAQRSASGGQQRDAGYNRNSTADRSSYGDRPSYADRNSTSDRGTGYNRSGADRGTSTTSYADRNSTSDRPVQRDQRDAVRSQAWRESTGGTSSFQRADSDRGDSRPHQHTGRPMQAHTQREEAEQHATGPTRRRRRRSNRTPQPSA